MSGLAGAVKLVSKTLLQDKHYRDLSKILGDQWSDCHSLTAAVKLMEAHGVSLNAQEQSRLQQLPEDRMIDALVMKMPQQTREQFEHFFLQLSLIASTTSRLRAALEDGQTELIEEILDSAENVGILQFILKMAVAQAGQEVKTHEVEHEEWLVATTGKMGTLLQSQANAMISQKALNQARAELGQSRVSANEKSKSVLLSLAAGADTALRATCFLSWADHVMVLKKEAEIRKEYAEQIEVAEKRLSDYIETQVSIIKNMINKKHGQGFMVLVAECFDAFKREVEDVKFAKENQSAIAELEAQMDKFSMEKKMKARKSLASMNAASDTALQDLCMMAWISFCEDYKKNKELNDAVKAKEMQITELKRKSKAGSKSVLDRMANNSESALIQKVWSAWSEWYVEVKKSNELQEMLNSGSGRFNEFTRRNKASAGSAMDRAAHLQDQACYLAVFNFWKKHVKVERMVRWAKEKNQKKKNQLIGVKGLFKNFASELESGLKDGTPRIPAQKSHRSVSSSRGPA